MRLTIVGCGKVKREHRTAAANMYVGQLFRAAQAYAEARGEWLIASAKYGLLDPGEEIEPYDMKLSGDADERRAWGFRCQADLARWQIERGVTLKDVDVTILAGKDYADSLATWTALKHYEPSQPLRGLGIGERLGWLAAANKACRAKLQLDLF